MTEDAGIIGDSNVLNHVSELSPAMMQRLAFITYLYRVGIEQARQPEPMAAIAILSFHDAVELFLHLAAEHVNANPGTKPDFANYFGVIDAKIQPSRLGQVAAMKRLNAFRVALKHSGILTPRQQIEQIAGSVTGFFEDNTPLIFGMAFEDVSLVELVAFDAARAGLKQASENLAAGDTAAAMAAIATAFAQLTDDYEKRAAIRYGKSPFSIGDSFSFDASFLRGRKGEAAMFEDKLLNTVVALQSAMKALSLGFDYHRYIKFKRLTPEVWRIWGGDYQALIGQGLADSPTWPSSAESCRFCFDFVIDSAIHLQDFEIETS